MCFTQFMQSATHTSHHITSHTHHTHTHTHHTHTTSPHPVVCLKLPQFQPQLEPKEVVGANWFEEEEFAESDQLRACEIVKSQLILKQL